MTDDDATAVIRASGNPFRDFGDSDPDLPQDEAIRL
jgi:hypothetical protein